MNLETEASKIMLAEELAAKVRGYFTNPVTGTVDIPVNLDGDRDLYRLASYLTKKVIQPGNKPSTDVDSCTGCGEEEKQCKCASTAGESNPAGSLRTREKEMRQRAALQRRLGTRTAPREPSDIGSPMLNEDMGESHPAGPLDMAKFRDEFAARLAKHSMICSQMYSENWRREKIAEMFDDTLARLNRGEYAD